MHGLVILASLLIAVPVIQQQAEQQREESESVKLVAPEIPAYHPKVIPTPVQVPPIARPEIPRPAVRPKPLPLAQPTRPELKPVPTPDRTIAAAPRIEPPVTKEMLAPNLLPVKPAPRPAPPKPEVRMGNFESANAATAQHKPKEVELGGFGDPNGVPPTNHAQTSATTMAKVGSFDLPQGSGKTGGGGQSAAGGIRQTVFGDGGTAAQSNAGNGNGHNSRGEVHQAGFGDGTAVAAGSRGTAGPVRTGAFGQAPVTNQPVAAARAKPVQPAMTPVEILSKPKPVYTAEARNLKLEGQVSLDVVFQSNGSVRILRVAKGLGHGLDEAAEHAALQVRFRPATRDGVPVDSNATIHITFELS
ncbi:MAG TPA: energy transducer TonB [Bryobacteraceae bacterium]|nr:energy transducer TonB [Bryobacteraceae bacterium]